MYCLFYSRSLMVLNLTSKSLIKFEFVFEYAIRRWSKFIILHEAIQFSKHHLLKRLFSFPNVYSWFLCHRLVWYMSMVVFLDSLFFYWSLYLFSFLYRTVLFIIALYYNFNSGSLILWAWFFLKTALANWHLLWLHTIFRISCFSFLKNVIAT